MSRACDLVSEVEYWHLLDAIASESTSRHTTLPGVTETTAPMNDAATLERAKKEATEFRSAAKLPPFMSLVETSALRFLGSAVLYAGAPAADATQFVSDSLRYAYGGRGIERRATLNAMKNLSNDTLENVVVSGAHVRAAFDATFWPAAALAHAPQWRAALRCSQKEAEAWSAFFFTAASCGVTIQDQSFVKRVLGQVSGFDGVHGDANTPAIAKLVASIERDSTKYTNDDLDAASRAVLLQATAMHEKSLEADPHAM